jgi:acetyltransferase-like isoleucine patch superfamily enzyme
MKEIIIFLFGEIFRKIRSLESIYMSKWIKSKLGYAGHKAHIQYPFFILGSENIFMEDGVNIGAGSTIFTTRAKLYIGKNTFTGPNLTIVSGDHAFTVGEYMLNVSKDELKRKQDISSYDKDIILEQDVWIGANVTILKGVTVGRGAILSAGSVIVKNVPPYSIFGGNPARLIKFKWGVDEIVNHEKFLFANSENQMDRNEVCNLLENKI